MRLEKVGGGYTAADSLEVAAVRSQSLHRGVERSISSFGAMSG
jgi:hypothetical protein